MANWFNFWGNQSDDGDDVTGKTLSASDEKRMYASMARGAISGISTATAISDYFLSKSTDKRERDLNKQAIENQVLAAQDQILSELSYNTSQSFVSAARGNVSIGSSVIAARMKKGAEEAGRDFKMLDLNAQIAKKNVDISYSRKRRASFNSALSSVGSLIGNIALSGLTGGSDGSLSDTVYGTGV